jgi:15-cis-phytoene desaturase
MSGQVKVAILGGGIGGLSAAQELVEQGDAFEVHVYEAGPGLGGKAKSQLLAGTGKEGRADLPGEHGFRFFPSWYRHIPDTMARIPRPGGGTVRDDLVACTEMAMAEAEGRRVHRLTRHAPASVGQLFNMVGAVREIFADADVPVSDIARFGVKMFDYLLMSDDRRRDQCELVSFFDFVEGATYSPRFQRYINSSRFMVAMDAQRGSACTIANKALQMIVDFTRPEGENDRVLNGPTVTQWLAPWERHLRQMGVVFHLNARVTRIDVDPGARRVLGVQLDGEPGLVSADHFIGALPFERMQALVSDDLARLDDGLARLRRASRMTSWMVGAQYFLRRDVRVCDGHVAYTDSPWALSSISQVDFWNRNKPDAEHFHARYGDGSVRGLLSIDISDWESVAPRIGKTAGQCRDGDEVLTEVWEQLKAALNHGEPLITDEDLVVRHLDAGVRFTEHGAENDSPLLVHRPGSWYERPQAVLSGVENLFLAADYVRTTTDLATMEGACEAARRAVNGLCDRVGRTPSARLFPMIEDAGRLVRWAKERDRRSWVEERRPPPPLAIWDVPRAEGRPTLEDALRYQEEIETALSAMAPPDGAA